MPAEGTPPYVTAIAVGARGLALTWGECKPQISADLDRLQQLEDQLGKAQDDYWAVQVKILRRELMAWAAQANGREQGKYRPASNCPAAQPLSALLRKPSGCLPGARQTGPPCLELPRPPLPMHTETRHSQHMCAPFRIAPKRAALRALHLWECEAGCDTSATVCGSRSR